jgi:hypothetical protein
MILTEKNDVKKKKLNHCKIKFNNKKYRLVKVQIEIKINIIK